MTTIFGSAGNYPAGGDDWSGQPRSIALTAPERAAGFTPNTPVPAEILNGLFGEMSLLVPEVREHVATAAGLAIPSDTLFIDVTVVGSGGGGCSGAGTSNNGGGSGGGAGRVFRTRIPRSAVGDTYSVAIGAGGAGGAGGVTGASGANIGSVGPASSCEFIGPAASSARALTVRAVGGGGGQLTAGGDGSSGGGGAGNDASTAGQGGNLGSNGEAGTGIFGRAGGVGDLGVAYGTLTTGTGCNGGQPGATNGVALQKGGGGGGGPLQANVFGGNAAGSGLGAPFSNGGFSGYGYGAGGGGGGQGSSGSGAGGNGIQGVAIVVFWRGKTT